MLKSVSQRLIAPILALPRTLKRTVVLAVDASLCVLTVWFAFYLRLDAFVVLSGPSLMVALASIALALPIFVAAGMYRAIFRHSGWLALITVTKAVSAYGLIFAAGFTAIRVEGVPRTIGLIQPMLLLFAVGASRALARFWLGGEYQSWLQLATRPKVLIYGAGTAGRQLTAALARSTEMQVVGYLDDDDRLQGHMLNGLRIYAPGDLPGLVAAPIRVSEVLLALPSVSRQRRNTILAQMRAAHVAVRTLPSIIELAQGKVGISDVRELDIDDLLGREPVAPNHILLGKNNTGRRVLVTGAGGSIGSELCRQIFKLNPEKLLLVDSNEYALYTIHEELKALAGGAKLVPLLTSVRDAERMHEIMSTWHPDTVYHAAAYKHVPLVEHNPSEGIKNNVLGTLTVARTAEEQGVSDFVLISTDKAVRPTNIMGASKRLAEMVLQALDDKSRGGKKLRRNSSEPLRASTRFSMVRFGNVLGSSGSVVPKFRQQIRDGGPVTLTHPEVTRYFMTIPEAAQLVIQASAMACGGDVFVLDMGQPIKISDLARRMIELSGLTVRDEDHPNGDIAIEIMGLRPGEKLYEELLIGDDQKSTSHPRILQAHEEFLTWPLLEEKLAALDIALNVNDVAVICRMLEQLVAGYTPSREIVDWVHLENSEWQVVSGE